MGTFVKKGTKIYGILSGVCPCCHSESMYKVKNPYYLGRVLEMHERCGCCGTKYKIEPSFFYGAMYVSYAVGVAISVVIFLLMLIFSIDLWVRFVGIVACLMLLMPVIMRLSRNIWINMFLHYKEQPSKGS